MQKTVELVSTLFKANDKPLMLSPMQVDIFEEIFYQKHRYVAVTTPSQAGKSFAVAPAAMLRSVVYKQDVIIVAPSEGKAQIIMGYIRRHCFDNEFWIDQLSLDDSEALDRLRKERSRKRIDWKGGGSVRIVSVEARQANDPAAAMGEGAPVVIIDESCLIPDNLYATIFRMINGQTGQGVQLFEISNPFYRNHFYQAFQDPDYHKMIWTWRDAVAQGRLLESQVEKARKLPYFDVLYDCKFPDEDEIDADGFRQLLTSRQVEDAQTPHPLPFHDNEQIRLGVDIGGGGDESVFVVRGDHFGFVECKGRTNDTMANVGIIERIMKKYHIRAEDVYVDDIGIGRGVCDRLKEKHIYVTGVTVGEKCRTEEAQARYFNQKAENYMELSSWIDEGGLLLSSPDWQQLTWIKYKVNSDRNIQIERKSKLKTRVGRSPDIAEALMLTFTKRAAIPKVWSL